MLFGCFFQEGRTSFEAPGFLIWDISAFSMLNNGVPNGARGGGGVRMGSNPEYFFLWDPIGKDIKSGGGGIRFLVGWDPKFFTVLHCPTLKDSKKSTFI